MFRKGKTQNLFYVAFPSSNTIIMTFNQVQSVISFAQGHHMRIIKIAIEIMVLGENSG